MWLISGRELIKGQKRLTKFVDALLAEPGREEQGCKPSLGIGRGRIGVGGRSGRTVAQRARPQGLTNILHKV